MKLYHFTDLRNLPSIRKRGLLSWKRLLEQGIPHYPGSSQDSRRLDARANLEDYVRLCLNKNHPMAERARYEGRIEEYAWLEIDEIVMRWRATLFSSDNAVANRAVVNGDPRTALESPSIQAEVLVYGSLNAKWIEFPAAPKTWPRGLPRGFESQGGFEDDIPF